MSVKKTYGWFSEKQHDNGKRIIGLNGKGKGSPIYIHTNGNEVVCSMVTNNTEIPPNFPDIKLLGEVVMYNGRFTGDGLEASELNEKSLQ